jgi:hypothetical protein
VRDVEPIADTLLTLITAGEPLSEADFDRLAREVFAYQFERNEPYRRFCERRGVEPGVVTHWTGIPAVPTDAFKAAALVCGDPAAAHAVFRTSGTTGGSEQRGVHYVPDLRLYDAALRTGFRAHLLPDGARLRFLSLVPSLAELPDSSLSHMVAELMGEVAGPGSAYFVSGSFGIDYEAFSAALREAESAAEPVCIPGTAFAFLHWLDEAAARGDRFHLPEGSRVMDTGGFKGRTREVSRADLYRGLQDRLGIAPAWMVNEYGMTEMGSQFYDGVAGRAAADPTTREHVGPGCVRTRASDPETLALLPHGELGALRHWDLANLGSVACIQTADLGVTSPAGFRVLGRASGAEARGCSLAMDDLLRALARD